MRLPPQIMPPRSYSISSGERDVTVTLTSLHCQTSCHGRNGGGLGGASPSSARATVRSVNTSANASASAINTFMVLVSLMLTRQQGPPAYGSCRAAVPSRIGTIICHSEDDADFRKTLSELHELQRDSDRAV